MIDWNAELRDETSRWRVYLAEAYPHRPKATVDFETRSACSLKRHGAYLYSRHPSTEVMCLSYRLPGCDRVGRCC